MSQRAWTASRSCSSMSDAPRTAAARAVTTAASAAAIAACCHCAFSSRISDCASIGTGVARTAGEYSVSAAELSESEPGGVVAWYDGEE